MASRVWNDINLPGFARSQAEEEKKSVVTGVEDSSPEEEPEDEVRIISAEWVPGSNGFQYNEQCFCDVKAEYLKETSRAKLRGNLHGIYDGTDEDMGLTVEGCIDDATMIARISIPKLYFINNDHYAAWQEDSALTCQYYLKDISHSLGANKIDSPMLDMPNDETAELQKFTVQLSIDPNDPECQNDTFTLFSTDDERSYEQVKTVQDDALKNNNTVELVFTDLDENLSYTLEHDNGDGDTVVLLQNRAYGKWAGATEGLEESGNGGSGKKGGLFKKVSNAKNKVSQAKGSVNDKVAQAKELKQSATQKVNEAKAQGQAVVNQANEMKQSAQNKVNEVKSQADDLKAQGQAAVNQANEMKQSAQNKVNEVKSQADDLKAQGQAAVNKANERKQSTVNNVNETKSQATGSLKDKLAAINSSRENAQKTASAAKEKAAATADTADKMADSLKSVPKFNI